MQRVDADLTNYLRHVMSFFCLLMDAVILYSASTSPSRRGLDLVRLARSRYDKIDAPFCGQRPLLPDNGDSELALRIVGGRESVPYSWPAICSIRLPNAPLYHFCGGNLVKNLAGQYFLITAAQCLHYTQAPSGYEAHCGIHNRDDSNETHRVVVFFNRLTIHPNFNSDTNDYDIAIFRISTALPTNNYISAVCIPNEGWNENELAIAAGWGSLSAGGTTPYSLHQVTKPIKSRQTCEQRYGQGSITLRMMCAGLPEGGVDSCNGDSGGPLYTYRENRWTLTGIISWGFGCAQAGRPGVYADVIELKDWINSVINI
ncbi:unnamed protein product [Lymnaea stagnalis]|uniref:Peptidase S1 domain-containing protein n=1 Tax=Lymnaea stagnalis TaxID=6523 RepID=A0AAV2H9I8_LYMST